MGHFFTIGLITVIAAIAGCSWLSWQLLRQNGRILLQLEGLEKRLDELEFGGPQRDGLLVGSPAPDFDLPGLNDERKSLADFRGQSFLLIFFNPGCRFCRDLVPRLAALGKGQKADGCQSPATPAATNGHPPLLIIASGDMEQNRKFFAEHQVQCPILVQEEREVSAAYGVKGTPSGYLIDAEGEIASELALGAEMLLRLANGNDESGKRKAEMGRARDAASALTKREETDRANRFSRHSLARSKIKRDGLKAGTLAPEFRLPRLDGPETSLSALRGRRVLLVFSSPRCGPCDEIAPKLENFHREQSHTEVIMISKGDAAENRTKVRNRKLTFPVLLQRQWEISRLYATFATPVAYLIDERGIIGAEVAVGTGAILDLMSAAGRLLHQQ
jgi:peroxiredoxin